MKIVNAQHRGGVLLPCRICTGLMARHQAYSLLLVAVLAAASFGSLHARYLAENHVSTEDSHAASRALCTPPNSCFDESSYQQKPQRCQAYSLNAYSVEPKTVGGLRQAGSIAGTWYTAASEPVSNIREEHRRGNC